MSKQNPHAAVNLLELAFIFNPVFMPNVLRYASELLTCLQYSSMHHMLDHSKNV